MFDSKEKIKEFKEKYRNKCFALANWKNLQMKDFGMGEMLTCICNAANGSLQEMAKIIDHLTAKKKTFGRTQVYGEQNVNTVDIVRNEDGTLELKGYQPDTPLPLKGQHQKRNARIFRKTDDKVSKTFQNAEERMYNLGAKVREMFPGEDKQFITFAMRAIRSYAEQKKIGADKVIKGLEKGRYKLDSDMWRIIPNVNEGRKHTIFVNESDMTKISEMFKMTPQKFFTAIKYFIAQLLQDPVNTEVPDIFAIRKISRSKLINYLLSGKDPILVRKQKICDKDENGQPKPATMKVKFGRYIPDNNDNEYKCYKKNLDRKLKRLYIQMFEKNLPPRKQQEATDVEMDEATGAAVSGQYNAPQFGIVRREMPYTLEETTATTNVGSNGNGNGNGYEYDAPVLGDAESNARHNGVGGSVSINLPPKKGKKK